MNSPHLSPSFIHHAPSIFDYKDYRAFVLDYYNFRKTIDASFSHRKFSKLIGFKSPSILHSLMTGNRGLSSKAIEKVGTALLPSKAERKFFMSLAKWNKSESQQERMKLYEDLIAQEQFSKRHVLEVAQHRYYSRWYYPILRELICAKGKISEDHILRELRWKIEVDEVSTALEDLKSLGLIYEDAEHNWLVNNQVLMTTSEAPSPVILNFQSQMLEKAVASLKSLPSAKRDFRCSTFSIDPQMFPELKRQLQETLLELVTRFEVTGISNAAVLQLNIQAFPLTLLDDEKKV